MTFVQDLGLDDDVDFFTPIPLSNVSGPIFEKIVEWCREHKDDSPYIPNDPYLQHLEVISEWDLNFLNVEQSTLFEILHVCSEFLLVPSFFVRTKSNQGV